MAKSQLRETAKQKSRSNLKNPPYRQHRSVAQRRPLVRSRPKSGRSEMHLASAAHRLMRRSLQRLINGPFPATGKRARGEGNQPRGLNECAGDGR
jgi:hypothetical protein